MAFTVVLGLRIAQFIFALITMGLAGYGMGIPQVIGRDKLTINHHSLPLV
jgi:hypothetical protein